MMMELKTFASPEVVAMRPTLALAQDHIHVKSPFCGDLIEILRANESAPDIAVLVDVRPTLAHFHAGFDEVYLVLDGSLTVRLFDPTAKETTQHVLSAHEACVIPKWVHHQISNASFHNRLCVLCVPHFDSADEVASSQL